MSGPSGEHAVRETIVGRFWHGRCGLAASFWLGFVLLSAVFAAAVKVFGDTVLFDATYDPRLIFAFAAASLAVSATLTVVQCVGVFRAAAHARAEKRGKPLWTYLAQGVVLATAAWVGALTLASDAPALREYARMAFFGDPTVPAFRVTASADGAEIDISGGFKFGLTRDVVALAAGMPGLRRIGLESAGGRAGEAKHLFDAIRARGLDTGVAHYCYSACVLAYAAGRNRSMAPDARLGFHGPSFPGALPTRPDMAAFVFEAAGFAPAFVARTLRLSPGDLWKPGAAELLEAHVVTRLGPAGEHAQSAHARAIHLQPTHALSTHASELIGGR